METITVNVNDKAVSVTAQSTITDLIRQLNFPSQGIAIAISSSGDQMRDGQETAREVIPQKQWPDYTLADRQDILIIQATQGG
ncbi:sulfur carrier protein ThiS [Sinomicrobium weinanense]|uniref:Sulfur carrier protein ThiS n=1 Tax=Sinomicrobium weinanense TaxID=2842200 RepID=A0A926Q4E5_9FLAO|nr:sulfur carrier protein ThiS [Sinomicrobium weinanense]MBC9798487.1 sulfur carrier protein ThiS [Sinomicrobium weinanense]MBU3125234.1 sulfur carrier protein ThiS [Sinomicrobium weinanense]